jgi:hypothetical protein
MDFAEFRQLMFDGGPEAAAQYLVDHYHALPQDEQNVWLVVFGAAFLEYREEHAPDFNEGQALEELRAYIRWVDEEMDFKEIMEKCKIFQDAEDF